MIHGVTTFELEIGAETRNIQRDGELNILKFQEAPEWTRREEAEGGAGKAAA